MVHGALKELPQSQVEGLSQILNPAWRCWPWWHDAQHWVGRSSETNSVGGPL